MITVAGWMGKQVGISFQNGNTFAGPLHLVDDYGITIKLERAGFKPQYQFVHWSNVNTITLLEDSEN